MTKYPRHGPDFQISQKKNPQICTLAFRCNLSGWKQSFPTNKKNGMTGWPVDLARRPNSQTHPNLRRPFGLLAFVLRVDFYPTQNPRTQNILLGRTSGWFMNKTWMNAWPPKKKSTLKTQTAEINIELANNSLDGHTPWKVSKRFYTFSFLLKLKEGDWAGKTKSLRGVKVVKPESHEVGGLTEVARFLDDPWIQDHRYHGPRSNKKIG